jgi:nicotinamidase-related amidase
MRKAFGMDVCESLEEVLAPDGCAVIVIDLQNDAMRPDGKIAKAGNDVSAMVSLLPRCATFLDSARDLGVTVVHVRTLTLANGASDSPSWLRTKGAVVNEAEFFLEGTWGAEICDEVAPFEGEVVVTKHRSSAFRGTDLDLVLRAAGLQTVVVIGEQTPGCVEATFRDAAYHDYYNVLVEDLVAAFDPEQHEASLLVQRRRHDVTTADNVLAIWRAHRRRATDRFASAAGGGE